MSRCSGAGGLGDSRAAGGNPRLGSSGFMRCASVADRGVSGEILSGVEVNRDSSVVTARTCNKSGLASGIPSSLFLTPELLAISAC